MTPQRILAAAYSPPQAKPLGRKILLLEFLLIFVAAPLTVAVVKQRVLMALVLWGIALAAWVLTRRHEAPAPAAEQTRLALRSMALHFAVIAPVLVLGTWLALPELFLSLPRNHPWHWLAVMLGYPILSVLPQEIVYRRFALLRYAPLFGTNLGFVIASGLAFGFGHVIFFNPVAVVLSTLGGFLFTAHFLQHRSLALVCLEHALYGCLIFSIGLGRFFFSVGAWQQ